MRKLIVKILIRLIGYFQTPDNRVAKARVKGQKTKTGQGVYYESPCVAAIMQYFNKKANIEELSNRLVQSGIEEIIILEDGSADNSFEEWCKRLDRKNEFVIRSNDLFEVRTYDRAIDFARGEIIVLLQDDDLPPPDGGKWVQDALSLFSAAPDLAILGGYQGLTLLEPEPADPDIGMPYERSGCVGQMKGVFKYRIHSQPRAGSINGIGFEFVEAVNRAPMFMRRDKIRMLGGIDQAFAPYQCDDVDICLRVWRNGGTVGMYDSRFARNVGIGGMRLYNVNRSHVIRNWQMIYHRYGDDIRDGTFQRCVDARNTALRNREIR